MKIPSGRSTIFKGTVFIVALSMALFLFAFFTRHNSSMDASLQQRQQDLHGYQELWEKKGIFSVADHARLTKISFYVQQQHAISDDDLDFWVALLQRGPLKDTPSNRFLFYTDIMEDALGRKDLSPAGQKKMYDAVLPFLSDQAYINAMSSSSIGSDPSDPSTQANLREGCQKIALILLAQTRDPRTLIVLKNFAQDSQHPELQEIAKQRYKKLLGAQQK